MYEQFNSYQNMNWQLGLDYLAYHDHNLQRSYDYSVSPGTDFNSESDYNNNVTWNDTEPQPDYTTDILPILPIAFDWLLQQGYISYETIARDLYLYDHLALKSASTEIVSLRNDVDNILAVVGDQQAAISDAPADAVTNYNVVTTLLGTLTGAVNTANAKQNQIATQLNLVLAALREHGLIAS